MRCLVVTALAAGVVAVHPAFAQLKVSISGEAREEISTAAFVDRYSTLAHYVGATTGNDIRLSFGRDLTRELQRTRSRGYDLMIGPAHVIGSAIRYGYEPVARFPGEERAVFIASETSGITTMAEARGARLALPPTDSLATYLARGELNAMNMPTKDLFQGRPGVPVPRGGAAGARARPCRRRGRGPAARRRVARPQQGPDPARDQRRADDRHRRPRVARPPGEGAHPRRVPRA